MPDIGPERGLPFCEECGNEYWTDDGSLYCPTCDEREANWPADLQPAGRNDVYPVDPHCPATSDGYYCTLAPNHRGDHLTLLARWGDRRAGDSRD